MQHRGDKASQYRAQHITYEYRKASDANARSKVKQLKEQGLTIFLTTHYMEEAEALCDRVCIIRSGKKVAEGTVGEVIAASGRKDLEEAYLFFMGEEELL